MNSSSRIIAGGGWEDSHGQNVKIKAWGTLFLAILLGGLGVAGPDWLVLYACISAGISLSLSVFFFFREKPAAFPSSRSGNDLRKLYGNSDPGQKQP